MGGMEVWFRSKREATERLQHFSGKKSRNESLNEAS